MSNVTFKIDWDYDPDKKSGVTVKGVFCGNADDMPATLYMAILKAMLQVEDLLNEEDQQMEAQITSPGESLAEMGALREDVIEDTIKVECDMPAKFVRIIPDIPPPPVPNYPPLIRRNR